MHTILAARSDFSIGESILTIDRILDQARDLGQSVVGITDTMRITGVIDFTTKAKKAGMRLVIGTRLRLVENPTWRPAAFEKKKNMPRDYFVTVYPRNDDGMKIIFKLLSLANSKDRFYYTAQLGFEDFFDVLTDDLAVVIGDSGSLLEHPDVQDYTRRIQAQSAHVYAALVPIDTPYWGRSNEIALSLMSATGVKPLVVRPALYETGAADVQEVMAAIINNEKMSDGWHRSRFNRDMHPVGLQNIIAAVKIAADHLDKRGCGVSGDAWRAGLRNTDALVDSISYEWVKQAVSLPLMAPDEFAAVVDACKVGWAERFTDQVFGHKPTAADLSTIYKDRLHYELSILKRLSFSGYFLLVQDIVRFAKSSEIIVGPGRGSVGGSLVAYLMGITECDPVRFGLMFERFINPDRLDLPDADLDFMSTRRHEVIDYIVAKYGRDRVAGVSNFGTLKSASAIRDVGRVFALPERDYSVSKFVIKKNGGDVPLPVSRAEVAEIDAFAVKYPDLWTIMERIEGNIRNFATHAAGIVVGGCDLRERAVIEDRTGGTVVCWDKDIVEQQGLVKVDILGLTTLDLIQGTLDYIKERKGRAPSIIAIPLDDPLVLDRFAQGQTTGIFQFESPGMRRLLKDLGADGDIDFEAITAATALYRPGPMESGMMDAFAKRKRGFEAVDYDHALIEPVLRDTFGVIVYQEQVMKIAQALAGYNGADADKLRKIMGKKLAEEMRKERAKFVSGCIATVGCLEKWAGDLFDKIEGFAGYGFNRSHSVEYTLISYQAMWLKVHYPIEFFASALTTMGEDKLPALLKDAESFDVQIDMPDINHSSARFEIVTDTRLVIPFQRIKGLSIKTVEAIIEARVAGQFYNKADFLARVEKRKCNIRQQDLLDRVGAFAHIEPLQLAPTHPDRKRDQIELLPGLISGSVPIDRELNTDKITKAALGDLIDEYRSAHGPSAAEVDGLPVKPNFGKRAAVMVISDAPNGEEDTCGIMSYTRAQDAVIDAMALVDMDRDDFYWTALSKRPKRTNQLSPKEIATYLPYLEREIEILKPPAIVLLGASVTRMFFPDFKGKASEQAGKIIYDKVRDVNFVIGFNPGEIWHDAGKQTNMNHVFEAVSGLIT
jgi:DNA polymerase-3 subunit alpha